MWPPKSPENTGEERETPGVMASASHITPGSRISQPELLVEEAGFERATLG